MRQNVSRDEADKRQLMEETPVGSLLWKMSGPSVIGVMAYNLYNIFDTVFVSRGAGTDAVGGVAVSFPLFIFLSAVSSTLGSGAASVISRALGEEDQEKAAKTAANTFGLFYAAALLITAAGLLWLDELLHFMGVTDTLMPYARIYTKIILLGAVTSTGFSSIIRAEGSSRYAMYIWVIPMGANIMLDCTLIFGFQMGVVGAAVGTVAGQGISMAMSIYYLIPSFLQLCGQSVALIIVNQFLRRYGGDLAITSYGIVNRIVVFFLFPVQGIAQGLQPVIGYNKGAGREDRVRKALRTASVMTEIYGIAAYLLTIFLAEIFMWLFTPELPVVHTGGHILRIVNASLLFSGIQSMQTTCFQAAGKPVMSLILSLCGQVLCFVPAVAVLSGLYGMEGVWYAFPVSSLAALVISSILLMLITHRR